jgi:hypothetical protein
LQFWVVGVPKLAPPSLVWSGAPPRPGDEPPLLLPPWLELESSHSEKHLLTTQSEMFWVAFWQALDDPFLEQLPEQ